MIDMISDGDVASGRLFDSGDWGGCKSGSSCPAQKAGQERCFSSIQVGGDLKATPVVVFRCAPGLVRVAICGVAIGIRDVRVAFGMAPEHSRLRANVEGPRLRVHAAA